GKGDEPTVTDADLVLGILSADFFLGGDINLDVERSKTAIEKVAKTLEMDVVEAAHSIFTLANMSMADEIIKVSTKRGYDVRQATMIGGGGGGPVHAGFIADRLNIPSVIIPSVASLYSAFGMYAMDIGEDYARSHVRRVDATEPSEIDTLYQEMETEALAAFEKIGIKKDLVKFRRTIDMRYIGQFHEVEVDVEGGDFTAESLANATEGFGAKHFELFTFSMPWKGVELLTLRVKATTPNAPFQLPEISSGGPDAGAAKKLIRQCYFGEKFIDVQVYDGSKLTATNEILGPAIIEETTTTVVIPENYDCLVNANKNYVLTRKGES
ncbi:MAG TPA: hydantoinase/oxoprolinase family protein, partial [Rhodospirillales bacterium]|nr:hydantoinase/oxoprolinase family protein [Rhodospirillales bacterium]